MKALILYSTSHGTTEKVATLIAEKLQPFETDLINIRKIKHDSIALSGYNIVIIGGSIHAGGLPAKLKKFMQNKMHELLNAKTALFLCCMDEPAAQQQFDTQFPELLRSHSLSNKIVGGEFIFEKMNFIEKMMVRKVSGISTTLSRLSYTKIEELVSEVKMKCI